MSRTFTFGILSDIHYACAAEQSRGDDYEFVALKNPLGRFAARTYRRYIWMRYPLHQSHLLDQFLARASGLDGVVANGDYSCNTGFVGVSDAAACQSASECLAKLREKFGPGFRATIGDHELGKMSMFGACGGMRLASLQCTRQELGLEPFWKLPLGRYVLMGVTSSLIALPVFEPDTLPEERTQWQESREAHLAEIRNAFAALRGSERVLLFCHDPTALPFLWREAAVRSRLNQIEQTVIGHLHSPLVLWKSRFLAGMPPISFLGPAVKRMSTALRDARRWREFRVRLCPALAGIELLNDGGFYTTELDLDARQPARFRFHRIPR